MEKQQQFENKKKRKDSAEKEKKEDPEFLLLKNKQGEPELKKLKQDTEEKGEFKGFEEGSPEAEEAILELTENEITEVEKDDMWKRKMKFRSKKSLTAEERFNCGYYYGVNKHNQVFRIMKDAFGVIILNTYQVMHGIQLKSISHRVTGVNKAGRKYTARVDNFNQRIISGTFYWLDDESDNVNSSEEEDNVD